MSPTSAERGRSTRQRLLDAAVPLIVEAGWGGVTTRMVAERAGVAPGVVHYHFSSVTDLLTEAAVGFAAELLAGTSRELARRPGPAEGVRWLTGEVSRYSGTDPASLLLVETFLAATRLPALRTRLGELVTGFRAEVAAWLRRHGHPGDADAAAALLAAAIDGIMLHRALDPDLDPVALTAPLLALLGRTAGGTAGEERA